MKPRTLGLTLAVWFLAAAACFAQQAYMGTWKLNEAKSNIPAGVGKNSTVVYEPTGDSIRIAIDGTDASGNPIHTEWTGKFDGKDYPVAGDPTSDSRSYELRSAHHLGFSAKKAGKTAMEGTIALSPDGKSRTVTATSTDRQANKTKVVAVYDKQ